MRLELYDFEVTPICFLMGVKKDIRIRPIDERFNFEPEHEYCLEVLEAIKAQNRRYPGTNAEQFVKLKPESDGCLHLRMAFPDESMYLLRLKADENSRAYAEFRVYALAEDMKGKYPFLGDLHMHTNRSDGREDPFMVMSNYRAYGYDFSIISDHRRYFPSLEARKKFKIGEDDTSPITDMLIVPGEEIHLPLNDAHYINFGGKWSINGLVTPNCNQEKSGDDPAWRSRTGECPAPITQDEFKAIIADRAKSVDLKLESERLSYAALEWEFEQVTKAGGLAIFPHPYWLCESMQLSEDFLYYVYEHRPFDAFEVLGGESYFQHNGFQTSLYYEEKAKGFDWPVVGSTDSHGSTEYNRNGFICSTIVFTEENKTQSIIDAVRNKYSVAVDTISKEYRLVGDFRWVKFGSFLLENWFPLHDKLCAAEGTYMREYANGTEGAEDVLRAMKGQVPAKMKKFFEMD